MVEIKGIGINDAIRGIKMGGGEQAYNTIVSQLDEQTRQLFENPILDTGWYPLDSFVKFIELNIKLNFNSDENEYLNTVEAILEKQIRGVYSFFVKSGSPESIINHTTTIHMAIFRGVSVKTKYYGSNKVIITYTGFEKQHRHFQPTSLIFHKKVLEISGAKDIHTKLLTSIEENKGYFELEFTWKGK